MSKPINPQIYRDAATFLREHGWMQGDLTDNLDEEVRAASDDPTVSPYRAGSACINGALLIAAEFPVNYPMYETEEYSAVAAEVAKTLQLSIEPLNEEHSSVAADVIEAWNDTHNRTEREVLKALEDTAARLEVENAD